jgi:type IV pilus assembly protein PilQ
MNRKITSGDMTHASATTRRTRPNTRQWLPSLAICLSLMWMPCAWAQTGASMPNVEAVSGSVQSGAEIIRIDLSSPLSTAPTGFVVQSPARIALDLPGVGSAMGKSMIEIGQGNVRSVNVVQGGERTRVVLNLKQATTYKTTVQGKSLFVTLDPVSSSPQVAQASTRFAEPQNTETLPIKDIDFRRTAEGVGRISVDLANNQVGVDIRSQGQNLVVEFLKSSLPEGLRRRLDVGDFGTPVQTVTSFQSGDRVRMVVEPKGQWEHSAYQSDNKLVIEVRGLKSDPGKLTQGVGYTGEKITLNFQSIEVRALLQVIADFTNFNIITSDTVGGAVTLRLKDVPWDQALDIILQAKNLGMRKNGNVIMIGPKDEIAAKEKQDFEAKNAIENLEPLKTQTFQLNYAKAAEIADQLASKVGGGGARLLSNRGSAIAMARNNQLIVTDVPSKIDAVQQLIAKMDVPVRQVLIEARIVEASDTFGRSLGVKLGMATKGNGGSNIAFGTSYDNAFNTASNTGTVSGTFLNMRATGQGGYDPATFAVSLFNPSKTQFLNLELSALEAEGKGKIVSSPRVITADQVKALIEQGTQLPYQAATSSGATSVSFVKANLKLEVTPQITPEGNIILEVDVNKDSVGQATAAGYAIDTKHVKTQVLIENGGTVMIGGIFEMTESDSVTKVPLLGDVPVFGNLFKAKQKTYNKSELLIFITPKMLAEKLGTR